ncbi:MAG: bifunctional diguanylate cyclase/phosphodiesterase [Campylobacterota bacterium]|nr:bifunctional diguanylate cyclase/phosphodiesterase [Campylobacterota bacterium]
MDLMMIVGIIAVVAVLIFLFFRLKSQDTREIKSLQSEISLLKNANEYKDEAEVIFSDDYHVLFANKAARKLLQLEANYKHMPLKEEVILQAGNSDPQTIIEVIEKQSKMLGGTIHLEKVTLQIGNIKRVVNLYIDRSLDKKKQTICVIKDIDAYYHEEEDSKRAGEIDMMTGLPGQFQAISEINQLAIEAQKKTQKFALLLLSINDFDALRTLFGYEYANDLLKKAAQFLSGYKHNNTLIYRLDCDNFLLVVKNVKSEKEILRIGKEINQEVTNLFKEEDNHSNILISSGIVIFPEHGRNSNQLIDHAFVALEKTKEKGEGIIGLFREEQSSILKKEILMNEEIESGLKKKEFIIYYQPIIDLHTDDVIAAEALIRWKHPKHGLIGPEAFIDIAQKTGLILDIGEYVLTEVIHQRKTWSEFGFKNIEISVNLSSRELHIPQMAVKLEELFIEHEVDPRYFNFDITETCATENIDKIDMEFGIMKKVGVYLSLDHFGVGGSSIERLQKLPIHALKVDRSLLKDIDTNEDQQKTVKAIVALAHSLQIKVVAEGIETRDQYNILQQLGCDWAQGYLFAKPAPAFEFQELLRK